MPALTDFAVFPVDAVLFQRGVKTQRAPPKTVPARGRRASHGGRCFKRWRRLRAAVPGCFSRRCAVGGIPRFVAGSIALGGEAGLSFGWSAALVISRARSLAENSSAPRRCAARAVHGRSAGNVLLRCCRRRRLIGGVAMFLWLVLPAERNVATGHAGDHVGMIGSAPLLFITRRLAVAPAHALRDARVQLSSCFCFPCSSGSSPPMVSGWERR